MFDISDKDFLKLFNKVDVPSGGALVTNFNLDIFKKNYSCEKGENSEYDNRTPFTVNNQTHFNNEVKYLRLLEKYNITPKIIDLKDNEIILTGCGEKLSQQNLPNNWKKQIHNIYEILKKENIFHNDIKHDNSFFKNFQMIKYNESISIHVLIIKNLFSYSYEYF